MKLGKAVSWLMGNMQRSLFPKLEECRQIPLSQKEQRYVSKHRIAGLHCLDCHSSVWVILERISS